ncbi:MAG: hypothetical protein ACI93R_003123 [Flavobacteriales bacterium]|jgi:hypothetical protein
MEFVRLKHLAIMGIGEFWSRRVDVAGQSFSVFVDIQSRANNDAIDVNIIVNDKVQYGRSHNSGIIDAAFIYNKGRFQSQPGRADKDFKLVSAHEFGHSVLDYFGGTKESWGHKGSTKVLLQSVKSTTAGFPNNGPIDLMMYYDTDKNYIPFSAEYSRTIAAEIDVKRLIWLSNLTFTNNTQR